MGGQSNLSSEHVEASADEQGANWHSFESESSPSLQWDMQTYTRLEQLAKEIPDLVERREFVDIYDTPVPVESIAWRGVTSDVSLPPSLDLMPVPPSESLLGRAPPR